MNKIRKLGRIGGGKSQSKTVYSVNGLCPTLSASMGEKGNTMPYIIVKKGGNNGKNERKGSSQRDI